MCRDPVAALSKDQICLTAFKKNDDFKDWRHVVSLGGKHLTDGLPVFNKFYDYLGRGAGQRKLNKNIASVYDSGFWRMQHGMKYVGRQVTDDTRYSFWVAFGVTPEDQILLEKKFDESTVGTLRAVWDENQNNPNQERIKTISKTKKPSRRKSSLLKC
jgi:hypothetical protein